MQSFEDPHQPSFVDPNNPFASPASSASDNPENEPFHPFLTIWFHPRRTIRQIVTRDPTLYVIPLACIAGIGEILSQASLQNLGEMVSLPGILGLACVLGPIGNLIQLFFSAFFIRWSGSWIGGVASSEQVRTAIAWSALPGIITIPLWIPLLILFGEEMFTLEKPLLVAQPFAYEFLMGLFIIKFTLGCWAMIMLCNTLAEVQGFRSAWVAFWNLLLASLVIVTPFFFMVIALVVLKLIS